MTRHDIGAISQPVLRPGKKIVGGMRVTEHNAPLAAQGKPELRGEGRRKLEAILARAVEEAVICGGDDQ